MAISSSSPQQLGKRKRGAASDGNKGSSAGGIAKLPKSAGSHSDTKNGKREDVDMGYANGDGSVEDQLVLTVDESTKLQRVVRMWVLIIQQNGGEDNAEMKLLVASRWYCTLSGWTNMVSLPNACRKKLVSRLYCTHWTQKAKDGRIRCLR